MVGLTFVIGPMALAGVGASSPYALWVVIALLAIGLAWTAVIPQLPPDHDTHTARVGLHGLWHAVLAHPVIMLVGFLGGFFELGLASILPPVRPGPGPRRQYCGARLASCQWAGWHARRRDPAAWWQ